MSSLNTRRPRRASRWRPISSSTACMRLSRTDMDMPSGVWVTRIDSQVESPTQTDFQPPLKPRL
ncbi:MAG TPA: hypothetical protein DDZ42_01725 [Candidatus Rokubacteria bacterium]|nr:hypothetical protein [Candidatus Rokubacteria bacterium]